MARPRLFEQPALHPLRLRVIFAVASGTATAATTSRGGENQPLVVARADIASSAAHDKTAAAGGVVHAVTSSSRDGGRIDCLAVLGVGSPEGGGAADWATASLQVVKTANNAP